MALLDLSLTSVPSLAENQVDDYGPGKKKRAPYRARENPSDIAGDSDNSARGAFGQIRTRKLRESAKEPISRSIYNTQFATHLRQNCANARNCCRGFESR
jgi:hypothetical protein